jgi:hypothetical protein
MPKLARLVLILTFVPAILATGLSERTKTPEPAGKGMPPDIICFCGGNPIKTIIIHRGDPLHRENCRDLLTTLQHNNELGALNEICTAIELQREGKACNQVGEYCPKLCHPDVAARCRDLEKAHKIIEDFSIRASKGEHDPANPDFYKKLRDQLSPLIEKLRPEFCDNPGARADMDKNKEALEGFVKTDRTWAEALRSLSFPDCKTQPRK